jgi:DNA-binding transcriptional regulator YdaS (Cro superfamily)
MTKEQATKLAGSQSELARIFGISRAAVSQWRQMPHGRVWQLRAIRPEWFAIKTTTFDV